MEVDEGKTLSLTAGDVLAQQGAEPAAILINAAPVENEGGNRLHTHAPDTVK